MPKWAWVLVFIILAVAIHKSPAGSGHTVGGWFSEALTFFENL